MKNTLLFISLFIFVTATAQTNVNFRAGYDLRTTDPFFALGINYTKFNATLGTDLMIGNPFSTSPVNFLVKGSYQYKFLELGIETGEQMYSTDKYDSDKNKWVTMPFAAIHLNKYFLQYERNKLSIGIKTPF